MFWKFLQSVIIRPDGVTHCFSGLIGKCHRYLKSVLQGTDLRSLRKWVLENTCGNPHANLRQLHETDGAYYKGCKRVRVQDYKKVRVKVKVRH